jgi:hypothetical protein
MYFGPELERHAESLDVIYAVGVYQLAFDRHPQCGGILGLSRAYDMRPSSNVSLRFLPVFAEDCVNRHINSVASNKAQGSQLFIMVRWFVGPFLLWNKSDLMPRLLR